LDKIAQEAPALVFLDLHLPDLDGMQILKKLKGNSGPPVIMMTGFGTRERAKDAMDAGAAEFVTKPFSPDYLARVIKKALDGKR
jgi:DNA-binding response OmpR family regulator